MVDPRFYEEDLNKLIQVRRCIIGCIILLIISVFPVGYLVSNDTLDPGYGVFHLFAVFMIELICFTMRSICDDAIGDKRVKFYNALIERNLDYKSYQELKRQDLNK